MKINNDKQHIDRQRLTQELLGAVEIDTALLSHVAGGWHGDGGGGGGDPFVTTILVSCVPPGAHCP